MKAIPVCYFPATVVCIDDKRNHLELLKESLYDSPFSLRLCMGALEGMAFLEQYRSKTALSKCVLRPEEDDVSHRKIDLDIRAIWPHIYDAKRFEEIAVVVVDYAMPDKNGVEVATWLRRQHPHIKILMLTGEADTETGIQAFNDGVIDKFVRKDATSFEEVLNQAILELIYLYFLDLSRIVIDGLTQCPDEPVMSWLDEPKFLTLFHGLLKQHSSIAEYYLVDPNGSYLFLNKNAKARWLACKDEYMMQGAHFDATGSDDFPEKIVKGLEKRELLLFLPHDVVGHTSDYEEARGKFHPATTLVGNKSTYYYAYIDDPNAYDIETNRITSYETYRFETS